LSLFAGPTNECQNYVPMITFGKKNYIMGVTIAPKSVGVTARRFVSLIEEEQLFEELVNHRLVTPQKSAEILLRQYF